jgi:methylmalonyl-CoA carboxyltransferase large subunit
MLGCGADKIEKQHKAGILSARERIEELVDADSFEEDGLFAQHRSTNFGMADKEMPADGVVTGAGSIAGRLVHLASQDFTVAGGAAGEVHSTKVADAMVHSLKTGSPFIFINDSGGARVQEGIDALSGYGKVFYTNVMLSGAVPQVSLICGPCAGGAAYSPALTDFIIQTRQAQMFITGPQVIKGVTGENVTSEELGGADSHMTRSGVIHFIANDDRHAMQLCQKLLSFLPSNNLEDPPQVEGDRNVDADEEIGEIVPTDNKKSYDIRNIISRLVDFGDFLEVQQGYAPNIVVGFARITGRSVGIIANQPSILAGSLDINASSKAARFIRFCNAFNIPLVTLADVPGFLPGTEQEYGGIIRHGAKMLFAYSAATVPKITVILRKCYGGAYIAMCSKDLGADRVFAWPTAEVAVMGAEGAAEIVFRKEILEAKDQKAKRAEMVALYREAFSNPYVAAGRRLVDAVIDPAETRRHVSQALEYLQTKRELRPPKKHGLMPL